MRARGAGRRRRWAAVVGAALALAACSTPPPQAAPQEPVAPGPRQPVGVPTTAPPAPEPGPDAVGVVPSVTQRPEVAWLLPAAGLDIAGDSSLTFYDPTTTPTVEGWPTAGVVEVGEVWVVGVSDADATRQWLLALDPASGAQVSLLGVTRSEGAPTSCTTALTGAMMACLYGDTLEVVEPARGAVSASVPLDGPAHSVHALDGDVLVLEISDDGAEVGLTRLTVGGDERWRARVELGVEESLAMVGSHLPVLQQVGGLVLLGIGELQLALDATTGDVRWQGVGEALAAAPGGGVVASVLPAELGSAGEVQWLSPDGRVESSAAGLSWRPAAANSGLVTGPLVADDGAAVVGVGDGGTREWTVPADPAQLRVPMVRADGVVVLQDTGGLMEAVEVVTGTVRWRNDAGSKGWGARGWASLTDGEHMVVRSPEGVLAVDLTDGQARWEVAVPGSDQQVWNLLALSETIVAAGERSLTVLRP